MTRKSGKDNSATIEKPSRSAKKRESSALQKLGEELTKLSPQTRNEMNLSDDLIEALALHDRITDREGARRQRQFIGRLMRAENAEKIAAFLENRKNLENRNARSFHTAENWRDKMISAPDENLADIVNEFKRAYAPDASMENLKQMLGEARKNGSTPRGVAASREVFREIQRLVNESLQTG